MFVIFLLLLSLKTSSLDKEIFFITSLIRDRYRRDIVLNLALSNLHRNHLQSQANFFTVRYVRVYINIRLDVYAHKFLSLLLIFSFFYRTKKLKLYIAEHLTYANRGLIFCSCFSILSVLSIR